MSFFKDFKEDLSQAVSELMPSEEDMLAKLEEKEKTEKPTDIGEEFIIPEEEAVGAPEDIILNEAEASEEFIIPEEEENGDSTGEETAAVSEETDAETPEEVKTPEEIENASAEEEESEEDRFYDSELPDDGYEEETEMSGEPADLEEDNGTDAMFGEFVKGMLEKLEEEKETEKPADASEEFVIPEEKTDDSTEDEDEIEKIPEENVISEDMAEEAESLETDKPVQEEDLFAELHAEEIILEAEDLTLEDFMKQNGIIEETINQEENIMEMETNEMGNVTEEVTIMDDGTPTSEDVAVITKGMRIKGDVESDGSIEVVGDITGNITCKGKLTISGKVNGNSRAAEIFVNQARIEGEVSSNETVKIGNGTVIIGNVSAASAVIAGAVKGDIDVNGPVVVDASAVVMGNIKSRSVQINSGAVIEGTFSQCYNSEVDVQGIFEEKK